MLHFLGDNMRIKILSTSSVLPKQVVTNFDLEKIVDTTDEWITKRTGIKQRHILGEDETYLDCAFRAARQAIERAQLEPNDIDLIILGTSTAWQAVPSTAVILQNMLGIKPCPAFDLQAACSGFMYVLYVAYQIMQNDSTKRHALVMGCDALSKITNWHDRSTCILLGDGFGAMVLGASKNSHSISGIIDCHISSDGKGKQDIEVPWGVGQGYDSLCLNRSSGALAMNGREVYKNSIFYFVQQIEQIMQKNQVTPEEIDWVVPHQANMRIIEAVAERMSISREKFVVTLDKHGNTSAASIPLAYDSMLQQGKIKPGQLVLFAGFGGGYTWGTMLFRA